MSNSYDIQTPYIACYLVLRDDKNRIALLKRGENTDWMQDFYGLIQGKVEKGESYLTAAVREAQEELGITIKPHDLKHLLTMHRASNDSILDWVDVFFEVTRYTGNPHNAEPHKHTELAWFDANDLPANTIPNLAVALKEIQSGKTYSELNWEKS